MLHVSRDNIYDLIRTRQLRSIKAGRSRRSGGMLTADSSNWMVALWALRLLPPGKAAGLCRFRPLQRSKGCQCLKRAVLS